MMQDSQFQRADGLFVFTLVACTILFSVCFWMGESIRLDEAQSIWQTSRDIGGVMKIIAKDVHMPLYFVLLHYWELGFGTGETAIRILSLLPFIASIPAIFYLALRAYSRREARFVAFITALSPFLNWYGSEARMYSLLFLFTILSHLLFVMLWKKSTVHLWFLYAMVSVLGAMTHIFFSFIIASQILFYFMRRDVFLPKAMWKFRTIAVGIAVLGIGWFRYRATVGAGLNDPSLTAPTSVDFFNVFSNFFIGFQSDYLNTLFLSLWPLAVLVAFTLLDKKRRSEPETMYFLIASLLPMLLALAISLIYRPLFLSRYLIVSLPSLYLLVVHFLSSYKKKAADIALVALSALMVSMLFMQAVGTGSRVREDYRSAVRYVEARADIDDLFVVSAPYLTYPVEYYYRGAPRLTTFPRWDRFSSNPTAEAYSPELIEREARGWSAIYRDVYMLFGYDPGYEKEVQLYMDTHYERIDMKTFSPGLSLYVYRLRYNI